MNPPAGGGNPEHFNSGLLRFVPQGHFLFDESNNVARKDENQNRNYMLPSSVSLRARTRAKQSSI